MKRILQLVASVVLGSAVFLFFHSLVEAGLLVSTIFGIATLLGGALLFSPKKLDPEFKRLTEVYGITPETVEKVVKKGMKKVRVMRRRNRSGRASSGSPLIRKASSWTSRPIPRT